MKIQSVGNVILKVLTYVRTHPKELLVPQKNEYVGICLFRGGSRRIFKIINILTYTCPNHSGVVAIYSPDQFGHVLHSYCIREVLEKILDTRFLLCTLRKCLKKAIFGVFKAFISNFLYYNRY